MRSIILSILFLLSSQFSLADECTHLWHKNLNINPEAPRPNSGDTYAGYGLLGFENDFRTKFVFKGNFAHARFTSFESYITMKKLDYDELFDFEIDPDQGSENPFREGTPISASRRSYTVEAIPAEGKSNTPNVIHISPTDPIYSFYFRIYSPNRDVILGDSDVPRVFAYDSTTGAPKACPKFVYTSYEPHFPQFLANLVAAFTTFKFKTKVVKNGQNHAIPQYMYALNRVRHGDVTMIRMKAPTHFSTFNEEGVFKKDVTETRYWSLCTQNFVVNQTLNCIADYVAKYDAKQRVTLVVGRGDAVKQAALKRGYNFLEDLREPNQKVEGFAYRNLLPSPDFEKNHMYRGDYLPVGTTCSPESFLKNNCGLEG